PLITVTPYGLPAGSWGLMNVNDHGFTLVLQNELMSDLVIAWKAEPSQEGSEIWYSDGTFASYDPTSGQPLPVEALPPEETSATAGASSSSGSTPTTAVATSTLEIPLVSEPSTSTATSTASEIPPQEVVVIQESIASTSSTTASL
ncbi:MAG: hypothetical protein NUV81_00370, partial [bacterium]|nr:hypothetical protein [bacterium]